ncbi:hypothetical protein VTL71DRAFT_4695 [Oculimacula yallundae]|uniref:Uncharacterized protein n=1 Tax=Oculimacula yallundae TaxID=86028 RepID=A0ABR4C4C4_9HELO
MPITPMLNGACQDLDQEVLDRAIAAATNILNQPPQDGRNILGGTILGQTYKPENHTIELNVQYQGQPPSGIVLLNIG